MLLIDRVLMRMPEGFGPRAPVIVRLVGEYLAAWNASASQVHENLTIGPVRISPDANDEEIARNIADQIATALER